MDWEKKLAGNRVEITYAGGANEVMYGVIEDVTEKFIVFRSDAQPKRILFLNPARVIAIKVAEIKK